MTGDNAAALAIVALGMLFLLLGGLVFVISRATDEGDKTAKVKTEADDGGATAGGGRRASRVRGGARRRRGRGGNNDDAEDADGAPPNPAEDPREAARLARQQQEAQEAEAKALRRAGKDAKYAAKEAEREERERAEQEALEALRKDQETRENEEFDKWKDMFTVEGEGTVEQEIQQESQGLLQEFIDHIVERKVVVLEELAAEFGLRTQDVVSRVQALESMGRITGVMDDRGKFIYISQEEMQKVAEYINSKGRVSISDLAKKSNEFVKM